MNLDRIESILRLLQRQDYVSEIAVDGDGWRLKARKAPYFPPPPVEEALPIEVAEREPERHTIRASWVGTYRAPEHPLRPGDLVAEGGAVGSIDSMRILNAIVAESGGEVVEARVEDGDPVEFGQSLFVLAPTPTTDEPVAP